MEQPALYPLKFEPIYKETIWGGRELARLYGRMLPDDAAVGESWEISTHPQGESVIANGVWRGRRLRDLLAVHGEAILGKGAASHEFPLLLKLLDAQDALSVQVHPNDVQAQQRGWPNGKSEAWYVVAAKEDATIIYGVRPGIGRQEFAAAVQQQQLSACLQYVKVRAGDVIPIPPGTVHALLPGVVVYEVQQCADITYRLYDYERQDAGGQKRMLHTAEALAVMQFSPSLSLANNKDRVKTPYFSLAAVTIAAMRQFVATGRFAVYFVVSGSGLLTYGQGETRLTAGESVLVPAALGPIALHGDMKILHICQAE